MNTRRTLLKAMSLAPAVLAARPFSALAASDPSRIALVIGNNAYAAAPLANAGNDARAMADVLRQANFGVDLQVDASRATLAGAIDAFGKAVAGSEVKLALFYYAGHGVQVDWRNYLLPVDVSVASTEDIKSRCIDLGHLLGHLSKTKDKAFVVILDACRDNPFGATYKPSQQGLSQFDAPSGSLLAYATSPGNVAADGNGGKHGLYTENLLREFSVRETRIEDAFKRVRLNVRLASRGQQIPWESTSLENDIFLFPGARKLGEEELEKQFEAELAAWARIKNSKNAEDWVAYLREYPNGKFSEIAQVRLGRLLAGVERRPPPAPKADAAKLSAAAQAETSRADASKMMAAPAPRPAPSANPYSAGTHPLGRKYTVGDEASFLESDYLTGAEVRRYANRVTRVDEDADRVELNDGAIVTDTMGNSLKSGQIEFDAPLQFLPAELQLGKKWTASFKRMDRGQVTYAYYELHIVSREKVKVPAGEFDAFRIEGRGWNRSIGSQLEVNLWVVPGLNFHVKWEWVVRNRGRFIITQRHELVAYRQQG
ncbi:MAG: hypothetical protein BroJett012_30190 [Betaproteobacteria bacterium]|nr:MAG: hypothetical protein BroJett012_30190 [Betaproteobacteria bacterium]